MLSSATGASLLGESGGIIPKIILYFLQHSENSFNQKINFVTNNKSQFNFVEAPRNFFRCKAFDPYAQIFISANHWGPLYIWRSCSFTFAGQWPVSKNMAVCDAFYVTIAVFSWWTLHPWPIVPTWKKQIFNPPPPLHFAILLKVVQFLGAEIVGEASCHYTGKDSYNLVFISHLYPCFFTMLVSLYTIFFQKIIPSWLGSKLSSPPI